MMPFEGYKKKYFFKKSHFCCTVLFCNYAKMSRVPCWQCYNEKKKKWKNKTKTQYPAYCVFLFIMSLPVGRSAFITCDW